MKIAKIKNVLLCAVLIIFAGASFAQTKIKVACVGNSITFGYGLKPAESYPTVLQQLLGSNYEVSNYGLSGRTLLKKGDRPYWKELKYNDVLALNPDVVIIKLGTNDTKPQNWQYKTDFISDYLDFINSFKQLASHPKIYICTPFPIYNNRYNIRDSIVVADMLPAIDTIAARSGATIIDLHKYFGAKPWLVTDGVHPNKDGAILLAYRVFEAIK